MGLALFRGIAGVNVGTSKVVLAVGSDVSVQHYEERYDINEPGEWMRALSAVMAAAAPIPQPTALGFCGTSGTFMLVDSTGAPFGRPSLYNDQHPEAVGAVEALLNRRLSANHSLVRLWVCWNNLSREQRQGVRWIVPQSVWISYLVVGARSWADLASDPQNARKLGADTTALTWPTEQFEAIGVPAVLLPRIVESGEPIGPASGELASKLGVMGANVFHGTTDANAEALGLIGATVGDLCLMAGSTSSVKGVAQDVGELPKDAYTSPHPLDPRLRIVSSWISSGENLRQLCRTWGLRIESTLESAWKVEPDERWLLPSLKQETVVDFSGVENPLAVARAIMEGVSYWETHRVFALRNAIRARPEDPVRMVGGTTQCRPWLQWRANALGREIIVYDGSAAIGTLLPAMIRSGAFRSTDEFLRRFRIQLLRVMPRSLPESGIRRKKFVVGALK